MGGKGGSGPSNNQMVQLEMQRAQEARDKENERQARLNQGKTAIESEILDLQKARRMAEMRINQLLKKTVF